MSTQSWESKKENVEPLRSGRSAKSLSAALELTEENREKLKKEREKFEEEILADNNKEDPLIVWCRYVSWSFKNFPTGGNVNSTIELLSRVVKQFWNYDMYKNDRRYIQLCLLYQFYFGKVDSERSMLIFSQMRDKNIGTKCVDFYIAWAEALEKQDQLLEAKKMFDLAEENKAEPVDKLKKMRKAFDMRSARSIFQKMNEGETSSKTSSVNDVERKPLVGLKTKGPEKKVGIKRPAQITPVKVRQQAKSSSSTPGNNKGLEIFVEKEECMIKATPNPEDIQLAGPGQENFGDNPSQWKGKRAKQSFILDSPSKVTPIVKKSSSFVIYSECNQEDKDNAASCSGKVQVEKVVATDKSVSKPPEVDKSVSKPPEVDKSVNQETSKSMYPLDLIYRNSGEFQMEENRAAVYKMMMMSSDRSKKDREDLLKKENQRLILENEQLKKMLEQYQSNQCLPNKKNESLIEQPTSTNVNNKTFTLNESQILKASSATEQVMEDKNTFMETSPSEPTDSFCNKFLESIFSPESDDTIKDETINKGYGDEETVGLLDLLVISTKPQNECSKLSNTQDLTSTEKQIGSVDDEDQKLSKSSTKKSGLSIFHDSMISTEKKIGSVDDEDQNLIKSSTKKSGLSIFHDSMISTEKKIGSVDDEDQNLIKSSTKKSGLSIFHDSMISTEKKIGSVDDEDQKLRCDDFQSSNLACNKMEIDQANVNDIYDSDAENRPPVGYSTEKRTRKIAGILKPAIGFELESDEEEDEVGNQINIETALEGVTPLIDVEMQPKDLRDDALICQAPEFTHCIADIPTDEFNLQGINAESTSCFPTQVAADYPQQSAFRKPYKRDCKRPSHCFEKTCTTIIETSNECSSKSTSLSVSDEKAPAINPEIDMDSSVYLTSFVASQTNNDLNLITEQSPDDTVFLLDKSDVTRLFVDDALQANDTILKAVDVTLDSGINIEKNPWVQHSVVNGKFAETNPSNARVYDTNAPLIRKNGTITFGDDFCLNVIEKIAEGGCAKIYLSSCNENLRKKLVVKEEQTSSVREVNMVSTARNRLLQSDELKNFTEFILNFHFCAQFINKTLTIYDYHPKGTLLDWVNACRFKKIDFNRKLVGKQLMQIVHALHCVSILHGDIKPDNLLVVAETSDQRGCRVAQLKLIDFGRAIDLTSYPKNTVFQARSHTSGFECIQMLENKPWNYHIDFFGIAATCYQLIYPQYLKPKQFADGRWGTPEGRKHSLWDTFFDELLNFPSPTNQSVPTLRHSPLPKLIEMFS